MRERDLDLEGVPVDGDGKIHLVPIAAITGNIVYVKGKGFIRHDGKTDDAVELFFVAQVALIEISEIASSASRGDFRYAMRDGAVVPWCWR